MLTPLFLCPECHGIVESNRCPHCGVDLDIAQILSIASAATYNHALIAYRRGEVTGAWYHVRSALQLFPHSLSNLRLGFWLAIEHGDYFTAQGIVNRFRLVKCGEEYFEMVEVLSRTVDFHNQILSQKSIPDAQYLHHLTVAHLRLLYSFTEHSAASNRLATDILNFGLDSENRPDSSSNNKRRRLSQRQLFIVILPVILLFILTAISLVQLTENRQLKHKEASLLKQLQQQSDSLAEFSVRSSAVPDQHVTESQWLTSFAVRDYRSCGNILATDTGIVRSLLARQLSTPVEQTITNLYRLQEYSSIIAIPVNSKETPHAYFKAANSLDHASRTARIRLIEEFVSRFPDYPAYTAPFLRELFDYYMQSDSSRARTYAIRLKNWVATHRDPDCSYLLSSAVTRFVADE